MYDLFNPIPEGINVASNTMQLNLANNIAVVKGLTYVPKYITNEEEKKYIEAINTEPWLTDIKRRVQHYGYKYDYKARSIDYSMYLGSLPAWALPLAQKLYADNYIENEPDQLIVNEYIPGQGITNHIDCEPCFGETIISVSLGSYCIMDFINYISKQKVEIMMEPGSLVVINGDARHKWTHGIAQRKTDTFNGRKYDRKLRVSMTFRKVIL
jgi:alkylated DNA repair dioxygenase AlkB